MTIIRLRDTRILDHACLLASIFVASVCFSPAISGEGESIVLYAEGLGSEVEDWSWTVSDHQSTQQVSEGEFSLYGEMGSFEAIHLGYLSPIAVPANGHLEFSIYSEKASEIVVVTSAAGVGDGIPMVISVPAGQWQSHRLALNDLGVQQKLTGVWWQQFEEFDSGGVYLDEIKIVGDDNYSGPVEEPEVTPEPVSTDNQTIIIYGDELADGYNNWSWTDSNLLSVAQVLSLIHI